MTLTERRIAHLEAELARAVASRDSLQGVVDGLRGELRDDRVVDVRDRLEKVSLR